MYEKNSKNRTKCTKIFHNGIDVTKYIEKFKKLYYYTFGKYEIDFLIKLNGDIIPVEVKAGNRNTSKSLKEYVKKYNPKYSIRISSKNFGMENNIKSVPLYAVFCINED